MHKEFRLYPESKPYREFKFKVSDIHTLAVYEVGNPAGIPISTGYGIFFAASMNVL